MLIAQGAIDASKIGVAIALRYACARPQFQGKRIMEYLTHQRRLLPALATTYAMQLQSLRLKVPAGVQLVSCLRSVVYQDNERACNGHRDQLLLSGAQEKPLFRGSPFFSIAVPLRLAESCTTLKCPNVFY